MGRARTLRSRTPQQSQQSSQQETSEEEIAVAIAAVLAGTLVLPAGTTPFAAVSALLGTLPGLPDGATRDAAARLVFEDLPAPSSGTGALRKVYLDNLVYRGWYAINAAKRIAAGVQAGEDLRTALSNEAPLFRAHRRASDARTAGAKLNDAAAERWGPVLNWNHTGKAHTHRPSHLAADGKNYRVDSPPVSTDGMLPGMALHCDCVPAPPKPGAEMLR